MNKIKLIDDLKIRSEEKVRVGDFLIDIPIKYKCRAVNNTLLVSTYKLKKAINSDYIKPLELLPGKSLIFITIFDFYYSPVGPYKELSISTAIDYKTGRSVPLFSLLKKFNKGLDFFVMTIAQDTNIAIEHGTVINGYPHYLDLINLEMKEDKDFIKAKVIGDKKTILDMVFKKPKKEKIEEESRDTYFIDSGNLYKIKMCTKSLIGSSKVIKFNLGKHHELSKFIRSLNPSSKPIDCRYYSDVIEILNKRSLIRKI